MSIALACWQIEASIRRARSLFGAGPARAVLEAVEALDNAAQETTDTTALTNRASGASVNQHRVFAVRAAASLAESANTDEVLTSQLKQAVAVSEAGASRLDALCVQARITSMAAATTADTPLAQSAILTAMRSHVARTHDVLASTQQQVSQISWRTESLEYRIEARSGEADVQPVSYGPGGLPTGPILIWCVPVRGGGIGFVCSEHLGNKKIKIYRAPSDESGVLS